MKLAITIIFVSFIVSCSGQTKVDLKESNFEVTSSDLKTTTTEKLVEDSAKKVMIDVNYNSQQLNQDYKLIYNEKFNAPEESVMNLPPHIRTEFLKMLDQDVHYSLIINGYESLYKIVESTKSRDFSIEEASTNSKSKTTLKLPEEEIYKNFNTSTYIRRREFYDKNYLIHDRLKKLDWILIHETLKIGDFTCKKAILKTTQGITVAWYTDQIPLSEGPSMFYGLPGLIIKVEAYDRNYNLIRFEKLNKKIQIEKPKNGIEITLAEFDKIVDRSKQSTIEESVYEESISE